MFVSAFILENQVKMGTFRPYFILPLNAHIIVLSDRFLFVATSLIWNASDFGEKKRLHI